MGKQSGLGDQFYFNGRDLSNDTQMFGQIGGGPAALDFTGIDKSAFERVGGKRDGRIEWTSFLNDTAGQAHPTLSALVTTDCQLQYGRGSALGGSAACLIGKQINYDGNRADDGMLTFALSGQGNGFALEWGLQLTAGKRSDTTGTTGTSVDTLTVSSGSTAFGAQFYLQVFSFTGTSVTIKVQESSDNGAGDAFADVTGGAFTAVSSAPTWQRIATSAVQTVERYLRVVTTGTFTQCTFAVVGVRNQTAVVF